MPATAIAAAPRARSVGDVWWRELLVLLGLTGFAISQPLLSLLGENPTVFTFHGVDGVTLVGFAVALALVPPLVLWGVGLAVTAIDRRAGWLVHVLTVAVLAAMTAVQIVKAAGLEQEVVVAALGLLAGAGLAWAYHRFAVVATWLQFTAILPAIALVLFLAASPSSDLLQGRTSVVAPEEERNDLPSVVVILLDELPTRSIVAPDGTVDEARFPHLAAFAEEATWYRHFTSVAPSTQYAVPAILTGNPPGDDRPLWTNYPDNLYSLLAPTHDLVAFETATELCGLDSCTEGPPGTTTHRRQFGELVSTTIDLFRERVSPSPNRGERLETFEEEVEVVSQSVDTPSTTIVEDGNGGAFTTQTVTTRLSRVEQFKAALAPREERPALFLLHLMLPHSPWRLHPTGEAYDSITYGNAYPFTAWNDEGDWIAAVTEQRHLLQAQYTDAVVGDVLDELRARDLYDDSLVIVLADHGVSFETDTPSRSLPEGSEENLDALAYAPLFIKLPGQTEGAVDDSNVQAIDIVPTVADVLDIEVPFEVAGAPVGSEAIDDRGREKFFYDLIGPIGDKELRRVVTYDDGPLPRADERWIPPIAADDDPMSGLYRAFDLDRFIGEPFDALVTSERGGAATLPLLDELESADVETPLGLVSGRVLAHDGGGAVIAAIGDRVVAASPLFEREGRPGGFTLLFPPGVVGTGRLRLALVDGDQVEELVVSS